MTDDNCTKAAIGRSLLERAAFLGVDESELATAARVAPDDLQWAWATLRQSPSAAAGDAFIDALQTIVSSWIDCIGVLGIEEDELEACAPRLGVENIWKAVLFGGSVSGLMSTLDLGLDPVEHVAALEIGLSEEVIIEVCGGLAKLGLRPRLRDLRDVGRILYAGGEPESYLDLRGHLLDEAEVFDVVGRYTELRFRGYDHRAAMQSLDIEVGQQIDSESLNPWPI